jgi:hypothetical protein
VAVVDVLLSAKTPRGERIIEVNPRDYIGWTPLHYAVEKRHKRACKKLMDANADPELQDSMDKCAYEYALEYRWTEISDMLGEVVKNPKLFQKRVKNAEVLVAASEMPEIYENVVRVIIGPPKDPKDIPPMRKSGRMAAVRFH